MLREAHKYRRDHIYSVMNLDDNHADTCKLVEFYAIITKRSHILDELMYDDYDLDYTYATDYSYDLEEYYTQDVDLDEDYARDGQDYESLAYRHYA